jgi:hypothetical protein
VEDAGTLPDFGLGDGGPLHKIEAACHVTRLLGQIVLALLVTWIPLMVMGVVEELLTHRSEPLLHDPGVHVRFFIAAPLLLVADHVFPWICRRSLNQLVAQGFVADDAMPSFAAIYQKSRTLADAAWPELMLLVLAVSLGVAEAAGVIPIGPRGGMIRPSVAQLWYALVASPLLQFLLWRSLWRWLLWVRIVIGLSRIRLQLVATHPDRCGGIRFLRFPSVGYCAILLFVASSLACAGWTGAPIEPTLASFGSFVAKFAIVGATIAFGPLLFLTPQLMRARLDGLLENDILTAREGWRFRRESILAHRPDLLAAQDAQTLDSLHNIYRLCVESIRYVVFDRRDVIVLLLATLLPVLPLMLVHVPGENWRELFDLLVGTRLP